MKLGRVTKYVTKDSARWMPDIIRKFLGLESPSPTKQLF